MTATPSRDELIAWLTDWVRRHIATGAEDSAPVEIDIDRPLVELGLASRHAVSLVGDLEQLLGESVDPTLAWQVPTIRAIAEEITAAHAADAAEVDPFESGSDVEAGAPVRSNDPIAIVGLGCRFPGGVKGPDDYWRILSQGIDAVSDVPEGRWESFVSAESDQREVADRTTRWGGFLDDVSGFDAEHFGIAPLEAEVMDPQQRLMLEVAWEALEHAGIAPADLRGTDTGVFVGVSVSEYSHLTGRDLTALGPYTSTGSALSINANRLSYLLDLRGPSMAIDTACSSSLVAMHQACSALRAGEASAAIVGGVNLLLSPTITANFDLAGALAADGRCKPFGADADGIVRAEGAGAVVLKRLSDAQRDGDRVLAVIKGSAVNSDGRSNGMMAPSPAAQERVLQAAYRNAGVEPSTVDYVEAHGTGTLLGDPIEARALGAALGAGRTTPLVIGSAKSNLGHMESAAGMAGVIKVVLSFMNDQIAPSLHAEQPNPHIDFEAQKLQVATSARPWPRNDGRARAGVSGFGFGGTNAHVVLEEGPKARQIEPEHVPAVAALQLAGASPLRVADRARSLAEHLAASDELSSLQLHALSAAVRRVSRGPSRAAVVGRDRDSLVAGLRSIADAQAPDAGVSVGIVEGKVSANASQRSQSPVWVFSGYGSQWPQMGARLLQDEPVFATALHTVAAQVHDMSGIDVIGAVEGLEELESVAEHQVAIFCIQVSLAALWRSRGIEPAAVIGHSMGEVAAAVTAGALSLRDGVKVMCTRSALLSGVDAAGAGGMAVLDASADVVAQLTEDLPGVGIAVYASPSQCTVAGPSDELETLFARMAEQGREVWPLKVTGAGHSPAVEPILPELRESLSGIRARRAKIPFYSTVLDDPRETFAADVDYWAANARRPVRFTQAVSAAADDGHRVFLEVSPHPVASRAVQATLEAEAISDAVVVSSLKRAKDDTVTFETALTELRLRTGADTGSEDRDQVGADLGSWVDVPAMPWRHERYWFDRAAHNGVAAGTTAAGIDVDAQLGAHVELPEGGRHLWSSTIEAGAWPGAQALAAAAAKAVERAGEPQLLLHTAAPELNTVTVTTSITDDGRISIHTKARSAKAWTLHASGFVSGEPDAAAPEATGEVALQGDTPLVQTPAPTWVGVESLKAMGGADASALIRQRLREGVAMVMGARAESIDADRALTDLGFDSLMATRARNAVMQDFGVELTAGLVLQGASMNQVAEFIENELGIDAGDAANAQPVAQVAVSPATEEPQEREKLGARDPSERYIAQQFADIVGNWDFEVHDRFCDITDSEADLADLKQRMQARFGDQIDQDQVTGESTMESLGALIFEAFEGNDGLIRVLRAAGPDARDPLWVFHPAGGPTTVYMPMVEQLSDRQPVYGMERIADAFSVEAKVEAYLPELRSVQPHGPYRLLGWSLGGVISFEMARQLRAMGEEVSICGMIDTVIPDEPEDGDIQSALIHRFEMYSDYLVQTYGQPLNLDYREFVTWDEERQMKALEESLRTAGMVMPEGVLQHQYTSYVDAMIAESYEPKFLDSKVTLYRALDYDNSAARLDPRYGRTDETLGWEHLCDELEVVRVPGNHISMIDRPNIDVVANHIESVLDRLERAGSDER